MPKKKKSHVATPADLLADLVKNIKTRLKKVDDYRVSAAILIHEARELVAEGAAGEGVKWSEWAPKQFRIGYREVKRLAHIGAAPHPETAMEEHREAERVRMKELRERRKAAPAPVEPVTEPEPEEFNEEDFVVEDELPGKGAPPVEDDEDVDGVKDVDEDLPETEQRALECWNKTVRGFASLSHQRRRDFLQWAVTMCVWLDDGKKTASSHEEPTAKDLLDIPAFLRRKK